MIGRAAKLGHVGRRVLQWGICLGVATCVGFAATAALGDSLPEALAKAYQSNPQLNAERARQRATDENVPQALAGYRPQIIASLSGGLQAVRNLLPDNTIQSATLKPWTIGVTVTQTPVQRLSRPHTACAWRNCRCSRVARHCVMSVKACCSTPSPPTAMCSPISRWWKRNAPMSHSCGKPSACTQRRLNAGDVTPTDTAQAEARLSRGQADLNAAEVNLAISRATYTQVIGNPPGQLRAAEPVDRYLPRSRDDATAMAFKEHPAVLAAGFDVDVASTTIHVAESSLMPSITVQGSASHSQDADPTLSTFRTDQASVIAQMNQPTYDGGTCGVADPAGQGSGRTKPSGAGSGPQSGPHRGDRRLGCQ
jgi:outer membrane protein